MSNDVTTRALMESTHELTGSMLSEALPYIQRFAGKVVVVSALDNLAKGASGGAVQAANVALGIEESMGLSNVGMYP